MISVETPLGVIEITQSYFSSLIGSVVPECFGVVGMANINTVQGIRSFLYKKREYPDKGVLVRSMPEGLSVDIHIVISYGVNISAIVQSIVNKVRYAVEDATSLKVNSINVYVDSMSVR